MSGSRSTRWQRGRYAEQRRGIAVVLVLGLLAVTLAVSYATLRGQGTTTQLAANNSRALDAQEASRSGLAAALRKISDTGWAGVAVPLSGNVTPNSWYEVTFETGDPKIRAKIDNQTASDEERREYPFHLTIESTGYAADPANPAVRAVHKSRCITRLVRMSLVPAPGNWNTLTDHTVYQWDASNVHANFPLRIKGMTNLNGKLFLCQDYPGATATAARDRYLQDLNEMQKPKLSGGGGRPDHRPLSGPLTIAGARLDAATISLLTKLGVPFTANAAATTPPLTHPGSVLTYRLYPGGQEYSPPWLQATYGNPLQNVTLGPDPVDNPLGIFRSSGPLSVQSNVRVTGTIISDSLGSEIQVYGTNVEWQAPNLPIVYGTSQVWQLPAVLSRDDLRVNSLADLKIRGYAMVWDQFEIKTGSPDTRFDLRGNLVTSGLLLRGRDSWALTPATWNSDLNDFDPPGTLIGGLLAALQALLNNVRAFLGLAAEDEVYFPDYMHFKRGFVTQPTLTFTPESSGVKPHWHDWTQPVYQKDEDDPGLRWELIRWEANR